MEKYNIEISLNILTALKEKHQDIKFDLRWAIKTQQELDVLKKKYSNIIFDESESYEKALADFYFNIAKKEAKNKQQIYIEYINKQFESLRKENPEILFNESISFDDAKIDFYNQLKEKERMAYVEPKNPSLFYRFFSGIVKFFIMIFFRGLYLELFVNESDKIKYHSPLTKLLSGLMMVGSVCIFFFNGGEDYMRNGHNDGIFRDFIGFSIIVFLVKGIYRTRTFNEYLPEYESGFSLIKVAKQIFSGLYAGFTEPYSPGANIDRSISYRNSKLGQLSGQDAADLLAKTAVLDAMKNGTLGDGENVKRAASYLDTKLGSMSGFDGVDYLANGKK